MKISGILPLRNGTKLGYPYELAIRSMRPLCDEIVVLVDPTSEDDTLARVRALSPDAIVESAWNMANHAGHTNCEISVQTAKVCAAASGDWILSLQADEVLHEDEVSTMRALAEEAHRSGAATGIELRRLYFYGSLQRVREDWTQWLLRLFKRGCWQPDVDGAMKFEPCSTMDRRWQIPAHIYHYSRIGDPALIAERVRNLDRFFHKPEAVQSGALPAYDFSRLRKLDTYVLGSNCETDPNAQLVDFPISGHPAMAREYFGVKQ